VSPLLVPTQFSQWNGAASVHDLVNTNLIPFTVVLLARRRRLRC
jgi:hypothetical protein